MSGRNKKLVCSRGGSKASATSKMEHFVIIVSGRKPLTIIAKQSILHVAEALDPSLLNFNYDSIVERRKIWDILLPTNCQTLWIGLSHDWWESKKKIVRYLSFNNHFLLMLMKLKLGLRNKDLVFWFKIKPMADYRIFWSWLSILAEYLQYLIVRSEKEI